MYYEEVVQKLYKLSDVGRRVTLVGIKKLLSILDNPHDNIKFLHVAGTNGKGSACAMLSTSLSHMGYKVGLYTSPHLISLRERIRINGEAISEFDLTNIFMELWPIVKKLYAQKYRITFYELLTVIAIFYFYKKKCDFVILETGLGGRLDATNVVTPEASIITNIAFDHQHILGDTLKEISFEKSGIIKRNKPVFIGIVKDDIFKIISQIALAHESPIYKVERKGLLFEVDNEKFVISIQINIDDELKKFSIPICCCVNDDNIYLVFKVLKFLSKKHNFDFATSLNNLSNTKWPGRLQKMQDGRIIDGAHNIDGLISLVKIIERLYPNKKFDIIYGCIMDKNHIEQISIIQKITKRFMFIPVLRNNFIPCDDETIISLQKSLKKIDVLNMIPNKVYKCCKIAVSESDPNNTIITGSLYLVGDVLEKYYQKSFFEI